jgi:hypothetical protein
MEWYLPITVLPGIGLLILSTSNLLRSLNKEIIKLNSDRKIYSEIISLKIKQLKRLNWSLVFLYLGVLFFLLAGMTGAAFHQENLLMGFYMIAGLMVLILAILLLIIYSFKSVFIREKHLRL